MEDRDEEQLLTKLINFGHTQWGFNHWSWTVTKQDLDFVEFSNGKYTAGVASFVSVVVTVTGVDIRRGNVGYGTCSANSKGGAIHRARKEMQPLAVPVRVPVPTSVASAVSEDEARAERKRRQKQAQEEFRLKQLGKKSAGQDDQKEQSSSDWLLMEIPTQDIMIEQSGSADAGAGVGLGANKRKSPDSRDAKRRSVINRLDIVTD